jgi:hypothetical protein
MKLRSEIPRLLLVIALVTALWCKVHHRYSVRDWEIPTEYNADAPIVLNWCKAAMDGEFLPLVSKTNKFLGAPFVANWNDFPLSEELIYWVTGMFARVIGLGAAINLSFLAACVLAAVCFYLVGRYLRWRWEWCAMGAIAFALSHYLFYRNISHLAYTHCWHIPLWLLVCWWAGSARGLTFSDRRYQFAVLVATITGFLSVYYTNFFLQLLILATLVQVVRRSPWPKIVAPASIAGLAIAVFLLASLDSLSYSFQHGINRGAVVRGFAELDLFALHPIELFIPTWHRWSIFQNWGWQYTVAIAPVHPLQERVYLGIIGGIGLILMLSAAGLNLMKRKIPPPFAPAWQAVWMIAYGSVGGLNLAAGLAGLLLFRAVNRVSIVILVLSLVFVVRTLSRFSRRWPPVLSLALSGCMIVLAVADQIPHNVTKKEIEQIRTHYTADRDFVRDVEKQLARGAMIFQLPVVEFPERPPIHHMLDYESLRPYLFSTGLRFSHGTCKGRSWDSWQRDVQSLPVSEMVPTLETYGFAAICLNQKAYPDGGAQLLDEFQRAGRAQTITNSTSELVCILLQPAAKPLFPPLTDFHEGWYQVESPAQEVFFAWSKGNASLTIENLNSEPMVRHASFDLRTLTARKVEATFAGRALWSAQLEKGETASAGDLLLTLPPGKTELRFTTDTAAAPVGNSDRRPLAFALDHFRLK